MSWTFSIVVVVSLACGGAHAQPASAPPVKPVAEATARKLPSAPREEEPPFGLNAIWVADDAPPVSTAPVFDTANPFAVAEEVSPSPRSRKPDATAETGPKAVRPRRSGRRNTRIGAAVALVVVGGGLAAIALSRGPAAETHVPLPGATSAARPNTVNDVAMANDNLTDLRLDAAIGFAKLVGALLHGKCGGHDFRVSR